MSSFVSVYCWVYYARIEIYCNLSLRRDVKLPYIKHIFRDMKGIIKTAIDSNM